MKTKIYWGMLIFTVLAIIGSLWAIEKGIYELIYGENLLNIAYVLIVGGALSLWIHSINARLMWGFIKNDKIRRKNEKK